MPIYAFTCWDCEDRTEEIFPVSSRPETIDCECGSVKVRAISAPARVWAPTRRSQ